MLADVCAACTTMSRCSCFVHRDSKIKMNYKNGSEGANMNEDGLLEEDGFLFCSKEMASK